MRGRAAHVADTAFEAAGHLQVTGVLRFEGGRYRLTGAGRDQVDLCLQSPGSEPDLWIRADVRALTEAFTNECTLEKALARDATRTHGRPELARSLPRWLRSSPFRLSAALQGRTT